MNAENMNLITDKYEYLYNISVVIENGSSHYRNFEKNKRKLWKEAKAFFFPCFA